jgi:hypothetical protein
MSFSYCSSRRVDVERFSLEMQEVRVHGFVHVHVHVLITVSLCRCVYVILAVYLHLKL